MASGISANSQRRWDRERELLAAAEPGLHLLIEPSRGRARITGTVSVPRGDGRTTSFEVAIKYPGIDPFVLPDTYDPAGRFPPSLDRHVEQDGRFCLWLRETAPVREFRLDSGLALYLCRIQEFLGLQLMYEARRKHGIQPYWPGEAWHHGVDGQLEWMRAQSASLSADQLQRLLRAVSNDGKASRRCPCGSGKRLGNCHKTWIKTVRSTWIKDPSARISAYRVLKERREHVQEVANSND